MEEILRYEYKRGVAKIFPTHPMVKNWVFDEDTKTRNELPTLVGVLTYEATIPLG